jgi:Ca2+-binding EF-hand superfamily protein
VSTDPLRDRFDGIDRDGNGKIDEPELSRLLDALGVGFNEAQARATFESIDSNGSGQIDFDEFRAWWQSR